MKPVGVVTRGTTGQQRLRRVDRWLLATQGDLLGRRPRCVVDLGFGAVPITTIELFQRLRAHNPQVEVVGLDIDRDRVAAAQQHAQPGLSFACGGFELGGHRPHVVRAMNVLRQYDEADVAGAWELMRSRLADGGLVVEGTCDESGRLGAWVTLPREGAPTLTLAVDLQAGPSAVAARLPKALIAHNVPGQPVHELLAELDRQWQRHAALGVFSRRQRFAAAARGLRAAGWPVLDRPARWRHGELTVTYAAVAPP